MHLALILACIQGYEITCVWTWCHKAHRAMGYVLDAFELFIHILVKYKQVTSLEEIPLIKLAQLSGLDEQQARKYLDAGLIADIPKQRTAVKAIAEMRASFRPSRGLDRALWWSSLCLKVPEGYIRGEDTLFWCLCAFFL